MRIASLHDEEFARDSCECKIWVPAWWDLVQGFAPHIEIVYNLEYGTGISADVRAIWRICLDGGAHRFLSWGRFAQTRLLPVTSCIVDSSAALYIGVVKIWNTIWPHPPAVLPRGWALPEIAYKAVTYNKSPSIDVCVDVQGVAASDSCSSISNYSSTCRQLGPPPPLFSQSLITGSSFLKEGSADNQFKWDTVCT
jgi:hypothetical protein